MKGGAKSKVLTSSLPPGGGAHSRALKVKSHNQRGAVVTNDWCITAQLMSAFFRHSDSTISLLPKSEISSF